MTRASAIAFAGLAAGSAAVGAFLALDGPLRRLALRSNAALGSAGRVVDEVLAPLRRAGVEGRDATRAERRRLQAAFAAGSFPVALLLVGPMPAACIAAASAAIVPRALVRRRERYCRALGDHVAGAATRIADALASGHTTRAAIGIAAAELDGPMGQELARVASDLELGATTEAALAAFRERARTRGVDLVVAAIRLQRRSGGNLAALLRDVAGALEDQARVEAEARAETAQARFTSTVVLAMPVCVVVLGELASPGMVGRLTGSGVGASLLATAAVLQVGGALMIRRLARVDA